MHSPSNGFFQCKHSIGKLCRTATVVGNSAVFWELILDLGFSLVTDVALEMVPTRSPIMNNRRAADAVHPDLTGLLVKNKNLLAELRNLQSKLLIKETSLQEMKTELAKYKENDVQQSFQIMSLRGDIKDLLELIASRRRIKSLKNTSIAKFQRSSWDLTERVTALENLLRVYLAEREKAGQKAGLLVRELPCPSRSPPPTNRKEREDSLDIFPVKGKGKAFKAINFEKNIFHSEGPNGGQKNWEKRQQGLFPDGKQTSELDRPPYSCSGETAASRSQCQNFLSQLVYFLSDGAGPAVATEETATEKIREIGASERSWKSETSRIHNTQADMHSKFRQLDLLLNIQQNLQISTMLGLEEKIQKLQKQLTNLKLSNKNMKTQLTKVNVLKDKTIEKLRQSLMRVETVKEEKADLGTDKLKSAFAQQEASSARERRLLGDPKVKAATGRSPQLSPHLEEQQGRKKRKHGIFYLFTVTIGRVNARVKNGSFGPSSETILKMFGFHMKTGDKEIVNQLRLIVKVYEISNKPKLASECEDAHNRE